MHFAIEFHARKARTKLAGALVKLEQLLGTRVGYCIFEEQTIVGCRCVLDRTITYANVRGQPETS